MPAPALFPPITARTRPFPAPFNPIASYSLVRGMCYSFRSTTRCRKVDDMAVLADRISRNRELADCITKYQAARTGEYISFACQAAPADHRRNNQPGPELVPAGSPGGARRVGSSKLLAGEATMKGESALLNRIILWIPPEDFLGFDDGIRVGAASFWDTPAADPTDAALYDVWFDFFRDTARICAGRHRGQRRRIPARDKGIASRARFVHPF